MRLVVFGTPDFSVATLERLHAGRHDVVAVVSQPDRRRGRGRKHTPSPVSAVAEREGLPLLRPEKVSAREVAEELRSLAPDLGVVVAYGQFLPKRIREAPAKGDLINGHASLLPRYRGAAPIARAILEGESRTGISVMRVEREMDSGPVALTREIAIGADESAGELTARLASLCADAIEEAVEQVAEDRVAWVDQAADAATFAPKIERADAEIDFTAPASVLARLVRAMAPAPGAFTRLDETALTLLEARVDPAPVDAEPGSVSRAADGTLRIATGDGWLVPVRLKRAGSKVLAVDDFLRGRPIPDGATLG